MKVLVTGAAGFIGQHVAKALKENDCFVIGMDKINPAKTTCDVWLTADITRPLEPIPGLDTVIHLAAIAAPRDCDSDPARAFAVNVNGTHQVLKLALASRARKVVFSSSAHVYDIPPRYLPTDETHPLRLNNTYTTTKLLGEQLCHLYWENHGLSYIALRLYNAYGPGQARGYFIPDVIAKAEAGRIDLQGSNVTKDWVYIEDVADAFVKAASSSFVGPINIGTGIETNLARVALTIAEAYGVELHSERTGTATRMCADWQRAKNVLAWAPASNLDEGLARLLQVPVKA